MKLYPLAGLFSISLFGLALPTLQAQDAGNQTNIERKELPVYLISPENVAVPRAERPMRPNLASLEREFLSSLKELYKLQVDVLDAQVNNDPLLAETRLKEGLELIQAIQSDYPESETDRRFQQAYRTVITEYQAFYGIQNKLNEEVGDVFQIQDEMLALDDEEFDGFELPELTNTSRFSVPLIRNRYVNNHLRYLAVKRPEIMEKWLQRSEVYFPMMRKIFREEGMPEELVHLAMIESGLVPVARSRARAVGQWQFIQATGAMYGLEVNYWIDERRDPEKATRAAARHLKDLYHIWKDWHLALANYNVSPRRMNRAVRMSGGVKDYWVIYPYLPRETRGYVPSYIATTMIATNPEEFGFKSEYGWEPYKYEVSEVTGSIPLSVLAECAGISTQDLKDMNPELLRWATPPGKYPYPLKLPVGTKKRFDAAFEKLPEQQKSPLVMHAVARGESLGKIAHKYGTSVHEIYQVNENLSHIIHPGQKIMIPVPEGVNRKISATMPSGDPGKSSSSSSYKRSTYAQPPNTVKLTYRVKSGDTIGHIAEWYDTQAWKIRAWNGTSNMIRAGQRLVVYVPKDKVDYYSEVDKMLFAQKQARERGAYASNTELAFSGSQNLLKYTVKRNDSLYEIARSHGTSITDIKKLNNLKGSRIYVGQTLYLRKPN